MAALGNAFALLNDDAQDVDVSAIAAALPAKAAEPAPKAAAEPAGECPPFTCEVCHAWGSTVDPAALDGPAGSTCSASSPRPESRARPMRSAPRDANACGSGPASVLGSR